MGAAGGGASRGMPEVNVQAAEVVPYRTMAGHTLSAVTTPRR